MKAAIYISTESGHVVLFLLTVPYTHQLTICAHIVLSALMELSQINCGILNIKQNDVLFWWNPAQSWNYTLYLFTYLHSAKNCSK